MIDLHEGILEIFVEANHTQSDYVAETYERFRQRKTTAKAEHDKNYQHKMRLVPGWRDKENARKRAYTRPSPEPVYYEPGMKFPQGWL